MIAEFQIGFAFGFSFGMGVGVLAVIALSVLVSRGTSITSKRSARVENTGNQTSNPSCDYITISKLAGNPLFEPSPTAFGKSISGFDADEQRAARFRVVKDRDGSTSSQENG